MAYIALRIRCSWIIWSKPSLLVLLMPRSLLLNRMIPRLSSIHSFRFTTNCQLWFVFRTVDNEPLLESAFGKNQVIPATVTSSIGKPSPNTIAVERLRCVGIGAGHRLSESLVSAMCEAGLNARLYSNSSSMKWSKLLTNLPGNALSAILDMSPAEIFALALSIRNKSAPRMSECYGCAIHSHR